ncbi:DUF1292 domain-containing protein [Cohnella ginsengisoli]|uniref:DUF1292 domain-containing protein n=1 Tax=Cohnella ginsengisoli TaxID=425004 RepID=A0A9X4KNX5_9BACL|nr:DUF1292 domain-containing protein [Cohnella ginsengisoli]MDG0793125.1 DUF1292 domain-containing protein [Cohnella ginsengisoli]
MSEAGKQGHASPGGALQQAFGAEIELTGESGSTQVYRILAELSVNGKPYAVLQSDAMRKEGEIEVFRVLSEDAGEPKLESVDDDEEWEDVAEAYDDLQFGSDDRP